MTGHRIATAAVLALAAVLPAVPALASITQPMDWGRPSHGGPACTGTGCSWSPQPVAPQGALQVDAQNTFNLFVMPGGTVMASGQGSDGQLGDGSTQASSTPVPVTGLSGVTQTDGGDSFAIALKGDGTVWAWGNNSSGMLGNGTTTNSDVPVQVPLPGPACGVAAGGFHAMAALCGSGYVYSWGSGSRGELGNGSTVTEPSPVRVAGLSGIVTVTSGNLFAIATDAAGNRFGWGFDGFGQLCDGSTSNKLTPVPLPLLAGVAAVSAGGNVPTNGHTLALTQAGTVVACGNNSSGQLGNGSVANSDVPVPVTGLTGVTAIAAGGAHTLALLSNGTVMAWGDNTWGQLGTGTTAGSDVPEAVPGLSGVTAISAGSEHSLALEGAIP